MLYACINTNQTERKLFSRETVKVGQNHEGPWFLGHIVPPPVDPRLFWESFPSRVVSSRPPSVTVAGLTF